MPIISLKTQSEFVKINQLGKKNILPSCVLIIIKSTNNSSRHFLGMKVTKKVGNAVVRNKIKRRIRHIFRLITAEFGLNSSFTALVIPRRSFVVTPFAELLQLWQKVFGKLVS